MKIDRLLAITMELLSKKKMTASELAEKHEVSVRTIYRDMGTIGMAGIPIKATTGMTGGFEIMPGYFLSKTYFSLQELGLMYHFLKALGSASGENPFDTISHKLAALNNQIEDTSQVLFNSVSTDWESQNVKLIHQGVIESEILAMQYIDNKGTRTERNVLPYHLIWEDNSWYLEAYCLLRKAKRNFKLSRIHSIQRSGRFVDSKPVLHEKTEASGFQTRLIFDLSVQSRVNEYFSNKWVETEDGVIVDAEFYDKEYALSVVLSYRDKVRVIEPDWLKEELINVLKGIQEIYKEE